MLESDASAPGARQVTVFNPDGSSYSFTPVDLQLAFASDGRWSADASGTDQLTVLNPDGTSYSIVPADTLTLAMLEPAALAADPYLPDSLTVFEPSGLSYSYEFHAHRPAGLGR